MSQPRVAMWCEVSNGLINGSAKCVTLNLDSEYSNRRFHACEHTLNDESLEMSVRLSPARLRLLPVPSAFFAITAVAACGESTPSGSEGPPPAPASATVSAMLIALPGYIAGARAENQDLLPRNPQNATYIQAKISMLQDTSLATAIRTQRRWAEVSSSRIPIALVFPTEGMRGEASAAVSALERTLPLLEEFLARPFPGSSVTVWYGFKIGNSGGGGAIYSEDRTTYETRTGPTRLPFDAILAHELGHSYFLNESITQFLELYAYNAMRTGSPTPSAWTFTRNWTPGLTTNQDVAALLDVYQLIGQEIMMRGLRAVQPLAPAYGSPLSTAVVQAFVDQVPQEHRTTVTDKLRRVTF